MGFALIILLSFEVEQLRSIKLFKKMFNLSIFRQLKGDNQQSQEISKYKDESTWPMGLKNNLSVLLQKEKSLALKLLDLDQHQMFDSWDPAGVEDKKKHEFFQQVEELDKSYVGGLDAYIKRSRQLLADAKAGGNPFEGWIPHVPSGVDLDPLTPEYKKYEELGKPKLGKCGFVLVAGGLGERLGFNGIKVALPAQTVTSMCYLELYCQQILAIQKRYAEPSFKVPLAIMVSDDTNEKTLALLEEGNYFGLDKSQVTLMKQGKVPALLSNMAHLSLSTPYVVDAKPHGHGDVHALMHSTGTAEKWAQTGVEWVMFFQDTNGLGLYTLPAMLGVSVEMGLEVNSLAVKRFAKQSVGAIARLIHNDGREMTINVEYNQLDPLLRATVSQQGDMNDPVTGFSPYPGNINQLLFAMKPYYATLQKTQGLMPEFVNPKYSDSSKSVFKKPTRLECMMQDYPKLLSSEAKVGFTTAPAWMCFSPCKNNSKDGAAAAAKGVPAASPYTAESDQYFYAAELLRRMGCKVPPAPEQSILGISVSPGPRIVLTPDFACFPHEIEEKFTNPADVSISSNSVLVLSGNVSVKKLHLNGSLSVSGARNCCILVDVPSEGEVKNEGHKIELLEGKEGVKEVDAMRGYVVKCEDMLTVTTEFETFKKSNEGRVVTAECPKGEKWDLVFNGSELVVSDETSEGKA